MGQQVTNYDQPVVALAGRFPLFFRDLGEWVRAHPDSSRLSGRAVEPMSIDQGTHELLFNCHNAEDALRRLSDRAGKQLVHFFTRPAEFLQFLTGSLTIDCIGHPNWLPLLLLPLEHAPHIQQWLQTLHPRDWPWPILDKRRFNDDPTADAANLLGRQLIEFVGQICAKKSEQLAAKYADRPTPAQILKDAARPLRVMILAYSGTAYQQFCARDLADAFAARGIDATLCVSRMTPAKVYETLEAVDQHDPDVLLLNGRDRYDYPLLPKRLCVLSWDQDFVLSPDDGYAQRMCPRDLLMVMVKDWQEDAQANNAPPSRLAHINLGTNHRLYHPPQTPPLIEHDILFVGNIHTFEAYKPLINFDKLDPAAQRMMIHAREKLRDWVLSRPDDEPFVIPDIDTLLRDSMRQIGMNHSGTARQWRFLVNYFRYRIAHLLVRELYVSSLTDFRLGLYGKGWDAFPNVAKHARPEIENGPPLRDAIHRSAINLHLHTWTVHHPRLYDTAAAGGFLLVGRVPEEYPLDRVFDVGNELDSFGSIGELKRKIRHYLDHPDQRAEMAKRAAERARRDHTMEDRVDQMKRFMAEAVYDED